MLAFSSLWSTGTSEVHHKSCASRWQGSLSHCNKKLQHSTYSLTYCCSTIKGSVHINYKGVHSHLPITVSIHADRSGFIWGVCCGDSCWRPNTMKVNETRCVDHDIDKLIFFLNLKSSISFLLRIIHRVLIKCSWSTGELGISQLSLRINQKCTI